MPVHRRRSPSTLLSHRRGRRRAAALVVAGALTALVLAGCGAHQAGGALARVSGGSTSGGFDGDRLDRPITLPSSEATVPFRSSAGGTTNLAALQRGHLMLVYFGYTHCPDVCPTTMADLGLALRQLPAQIQQATQVVFVTSDPARDTTPVMRAWLANFDAGLTRPFIGLTASLRQIDRIATSVGVPLAPPVTHADGTVSVEHGAQTLAFIRDQAGVVWLTGTTAADYAHDITTLTEHGGSL